MKGKGELVLIALLVVVAAAAALYPILSGMQHARIQRQMLKDYTASLQSIPEDTIDREWKQARAYNRSLAQSYVRITDPFDGKVHASYRKNYDKLLNVSGNGMMGYIEIPKINLKLSIMHGIDDETLLNSAGHLPGTSLPVGGKNSHAVLSAHRGLPSAKLFTDLDQLQENDIFMIHVLDKVLYYKVMQVKVVEPENTDDLTIVEGKDYVTLVTCTPYAVNSHRLLVRGERTSKPPDSDLFAGFSIINFFRLHFYGISVAVIAIGSIFAFVRILRKPRKTNS